MRGSSVFVSFLLFAASADCGTWYVDAAAPCIGGNGSQAAPFCQIQSAIAVAQTGDVISVAPGVYAESLDIGTEGLTIAGAGSDRTTIRPPVDLNGIAALQVSALVVQDLKIVSDATPSAAIGISNPAMSSTAGTLEVRRCVIRGFETGIWHGGASSVVVSDTLIAHNEGDGIASFTAKDLSVRNCTVAFNGGRGISATLGPFNSYTITNCLIVGNGWWAVERYYHGKNPVITYCDMFANNTANPPFAPGAGPFVNYVAEGNGFYNSFTPTPGPVLALDPALVLFSSDDVQLAPGSPCIDAGDPSALPDPAHPFDVLGFGHPRVADGNLDFVPRLDIGAVEFGGLVGPTQVSTSGNLVLVQTGFPSGAVGLLAGLEGSGMPLGPAGTLFLGPAALVLLAAGTLPASGTTTSLNSAVPPSVVGLRVGFQGASQSPTVGAVRLTNLSSVLFVP